MTSDGTGTEPGVITKLGPLSFVNTVARAKDLIVAKGMKLFAVIDQRAEAQAAGLDPLTDALTSPQTPTAP
jgi:uncharacterized protein (DUF302 family)